MTYFKDPEALFFTLIFTAIAIWMWYISETCITPTFKLLFQKTHTMSRKNEIRLKIGIRLFNLGFACFLIGCIYCILIVAYTCKVDDTVLVLFHISIMSGIPILVGLFMVLLF